MSVEEVEVVVVEVEVEMEAVVTTGGGLQIDLAETEVDFVEEFLQEEKPTTGSLWKTCLARHHGR